MHDARFNDCRLHKVGFLLAPLRRRGKYTVLFSLLTSPRRKIARMISQEVTPFTLIDINTRACR
jgi:hypothetical protein